MRLCHYGSAIFGHAAGAAAALALVSKGQVYGSRSVHDVNVTELQQLLLSQNQLLKAAPDNGSV